MKSTVLVIFLRDLFTFLIYYGFSCWLFLYMMFSIWARKYLFIWRLHTFNFLFVWFRIRFCLIYIYLLFSFSVVFALHIFLFPKFYEMSFISNNSWELQSFVIFLRNREFLNQRSGNKNICTFLCNLQYCKDNNF